jgi:Glycosyltransferase family 87
MSVSQRISREQLRTATPLLIAWLVSRALLLLFTYNEVTYIDHGSLVGDVQTYNKWSLVFAHGHFPQHDAQWQYPPGASVFIVLPRMVKYATGLSYYSAFYLMALLSDLVVFLLVMFACWRTAARVERTGGKFSASYAAGAADAAQLLAAGGDRADQRRSGSGTAGRGRRIDYTGAWAYLAAIFALGPIVLCRYDICVTMVATIALVVIGRTRAGTWRMRGGAIGLGAMMKLWPAVLLLGLPKRTDGRRALVWAVLGVLVPTLALMAALPGALSFLREQGDRGLEIESVLATPFMIARHLGYPGKIIHAYGAFEITGPGLGLISSGAVVLTVTGLMWLLLWRRRAGLVPGRWSTSLFYDSSLVAAMITIITSRVLSPQYLTWVIGLIALCLTLTPLGRNGTVLARPCWLLLAAISVTQIEFPWLFPRLVEGSAWVAVLVAARDLLLVAATWQAARALWRAAADQVPARTDEPVGDPLATDGVWDPAPPQYQGLPDQVS